MAVADTNTRNDTQNWMGFFIKKEKEIVCELAVTYVQLEKKLGRMHHRGESHLMGQIFPHPFVLTPQTHDLQVLQCYKSDL